MAVLPVEGPRVRLRRFRSDDLDAFVGYRSLKVVYRYQSWPRPYTRALGRELIEQVSVGPLLRPGLWTQIAIAERETDALLGDIGTHTSAAAPWRYQLGYSIAPAQQRRGLAREAVGLWLETLRAQPRALEVVAITDQRNLASKALLSRLGFELRSREHAEYFGEPCVDEHYAYALT